MKQTNFVVRILMLCASFSAVTWGQGADNELKLGRVGSEGGYAPLTQRDQYGQYDQWTKLGPQDYRTVAETGIDGIFVPYQVSTKISTTGMQFSFPSSLQSAGSPINNLRYPWQFGLGATSENDAPSLNNYFTPRNIDWAANSLFAHASAGITYDLNELKTAGNYFSKFTTYFGMSYSNDTWGSSSTAYAILVDGVMVSSGGGFSTSNPFSALLDISLNEDSRFLTLAVLDDGNGNNYDHGVFVAPTLTSVPEPTSISLLALGGFALVLYKRRRA